MIQFLVLGMHGWGKGTKWGDEGEDLPVKAWEAF